MVSEFLTVMHPPGSHYELHHGQLVLVPPPKTEHERLQERLREMFRKIIDTRGLSLTVRVAKAFQPKPEYEVWRADVAVVRSDREQATPGNSYFQGAPEIVVEVLSASNTVDEMEDKMRTCLGNGCSSFWEVDPKLGEVRVTGTDGMTRRYGRGDRIAFEADYVSVAEIFDE